MSEAARYETKRKHAMRVCAGFRGLVTLRRMTTYRCPRCASSLTTTLYEGVEIETCPTCEGEWLDKSELQTIVRTVERTFTPEELEALDRVTGRATRRSTPPERLLRCPKCPEQDLQPFNYATTTGIILDRCPACGGLWFDRHELEMVQSFVESCSAEVDSDAKRLRPVLDAAKAAAADASAVPAAQVARFGLLSSLFRPFL